MSNYIKGGNGKGSGSFVTGLPPADLAGEIANHYSFRKEHYGTNGGTVVRVEGLRFNPDSEEELKAAVMMGLNRFAMRRISKDVFGPYSHPAAPVRVIFDGDNGNGLDISIMPGDSPGSNLIDYSCGSLKQDLEPCSGDVEFLNKLAQKSVG